MPENQPQVDEIFDEALRLAPGPERAQYLDEACGDDLDLKQRAERLLLAVTEAGSFLESPAQDPSPTIDQPITEKPGTQIDCYKLRERIGEGGMGTVFVAEQQEPIRRKVALKVIKPGMDSGPVIARFEAERQALGMMDHPNIAKVFDAGTTGLGLPYFVMELVRGISITEYCDQKKLPLGERIELFTQVCRAIQHAHQKAIIHRDIKPSNILVTELDGKALTKVIDFGVAKALNQSLTDRTVYTSFQSIIGTPLYMSPEQATLSAVDVDTRSDVYALGVLLYELLTGSTPFDAQRFREAAIDEACRIIREEEPLKPSTKIATLGQTVTTVSRNRSTEPEKLGKSVRGDLDWIVMKALEKDRARRYESPTSLAADVQRYLADEPVMARPPSKVYRLAKFTKKHRVGLATASFALTVALGAFVSVSWFAIKTSVIARDLESQRTRADEAAKTAERLLLEQRGSLFDQGITDILSGNLEGADRRIAGLRQIGAQDFAKKLDAYRRIQLGDYEGAIPILQSAVEKQPDSIAYRALLTIAYDRIGDMSRKIQSGNVLSKLDPATNEDIVFAAMGTSAGRDPQSRLELLERSFEARPSPVLLMTIGTKRGDLAFETLDVEEADASVEKVNAAKQLLGLKSGEVRFRCLRTALYAASTRRACEKNWEQVLLDVEDVAEAIRKSPDTIYLERLYLAQYDYERGDPARALQMHKRDAIAGNDLAQLYYLALAAECGTGVDADLLTSLEASERGGLGQMGLCFYHLFQDNEAGALRIAENPGSHFEFITRLAALTATGHQPEARDVASRGVQLFGGEQADINMSFWGTIFFPSIAGDWDEPRVFRETAEFAGLQSTAASEMHFFLALNCLGSKQPDKAREHFQASVDLRCFIRPSHVWSRAFMKKLDKQLKR